MASGKPLKRRMLSDAPPAEQDAVEPKARAEWPGVLLLIALAFAVRLVRLGTVNLRSDEVLELLKAEYLHDVLFRAMFLDTHAPFFPLVTALWSLLGLTSNDWLVRLLPATLGVASVPVMYGLARSLYGRRAAWIASLLLAVSPFFVVLSRDMKDDIFLVLIGMVAALCLVTAVQRNRPAYWVAYALTAAIACYSQFFMGPLLVMLNLWYLATIRAFPGRFRNWFVANTVAFILVIPVLLFALHRSHALLVESDRWWVPRPTPTLVMFYLKTLAFGYSDLKPYYKIALALYGVAAFAGFVISWRKDVKWALLLLFWMPATVGIIIAISLNGQSVFLYRSMALYGIPFYIWAALGIARIPSAAARTGVLAAMLLLASTSLFQLYENRFSVLEVPHRLGHTLPLPYRAVAEFIGPRSLPGDFVAHTAHISIFPLYYYGLKELPHANVGVEPDPIDNFLRCNPRILVPPQFENCYMTALQPLVQDRNRVWLVFTESERLYMPNNPMSVYRWLDAHYTETLHQSFGNMEVFLFQREQDGVPITVHSRDRDDGVSAQLGYAGGSDATYTKFRPDSGLVASPPEARKGDLTLYFEDNPTGPVEGQPDASGPAVAFSIANRSSQAVSCSVEVVFSDYLLEFASLNEAAPASGTWLVADMFNPDKLPPAYGMSVAASHLTDANPATIKGELSLAPGVYDTQVRLLGLPGDASQARSVMAFDVAGKDLFAPLRGSRSAPFAWTWFATERVEVPAGPPASTPVSLLAHLPAGVKESWNDAAYAAFVSTNETSPRPAGAAVPVQPGQVTIPPQGTRTWKYAGGARRVDVWAYESGANGHAYRIFRIQDPNPTP